MSKNREILVLEAGGSELRIAHVSIRGDTVAVGECASFHAVELGDDNPAIQDQNLLDELAAYVTERGWTGRDVLCLLGGDSVSCQYFEMPPLKGLALRQAVLLKLGQQLHFEIGEAVVDVAPIAGTSSAETNLQRVAVTAVRRQRAQAAIDAATRMGLNPTLVSAAPVAMAAMAADKLGGDDPMRAALHVGERASVLTVFSGQTPCVVSELAIGLADFAIALTRPIISGEDVIQLELEEATALRDRVGIPEAGLEIESLGIKGGNLMPLLAPTLQKLSKQLTQWLTFAATSAGDAEASTLTLVGPGASMHGLTGAIGVGIGMSVETADWLTGATIASRSSDAPPLESSTIAVAAALYAGGLPELTPPEVRTRRKIKRVRRSTALVSPVLAAAIFGLAFLFEQMGTGLQPVVGENQQSLAGMRKLAEVNQQWNAAQVEVDRLQGEFDVFASATPHWEGLFKELSRTLPGELQTTRLDARMEPTGLVVRMEATIYPAPQGRNLEEIVEQTLLSFARSPFFEDVQLLKSIVSEGGRGAPNAAAGTLSVDLRLAYPRPRKGGA